MYDEILLPADRDPTAEQAMPHVFDLAERFDTTVHVLFIVNATRDSTSVVGSTVLDALEREGRRVVDEAETRGERHGIETHSVVRRGTPYNVILNYATRRGVEVIMMTTHGRTGVECVLLGGMTERVVQAAPVPVLTVRAAE